MSLYFLYMEYPDWYHWRREWDFPFHLIVMPVFDFFLRHKFPKRTTFNSTRCIRLPSAAYCSSVAIKQPWPYRHLLFIVLPIHHYECFLLPHISSGKLRRVTSLSCRGGQDPCPKHDRSVVQIGRFYFDVIITSLRRARVLDGVQRGIADTRVR